MDCSPPGSSVHGISQARSLQWVVVALSSSKGSSQPRDQSCVSCVSLHWQADSSPAEPPGKLCILYIVFIHGLPQWLSRQRVRLQCRSYRRRGFDLWVRKIPWRRKWLPTAVFLPGKFQGQRSRAGYSPWGGKETDAAEHARTECIYTSPNRDTVINTNKGVSMAEEEWGGLAVTSPSPCR